MKTIIALVVYATIISGTTTTKTFGQYSANSIAFASIKYTPAWVSYLTEYSDEVKKTKSKNSKDALKAAEEELKGSKATIKALKANMKAAKDFSKEFSNASNVAWTVEEKLIIATFANSGVNTEVRYNKKGNWLNTLTYYNESQMPNELKSQVKNEYRGYSITGMQEIKENQITFYIIHIENLKGFKKLLSYDGELSLFQQYDRN